MNLKKSFLFAGLSAAAVAAALVVPPSTSSFSPVPTLFADSLSCSLRRELELNSGLNYEERAKFAKRRRQMDAFLGALSVLRSHP